MKGIGTENKSKGVHMVSNTYVSVSQMRERAERLFLGGDLLRQAGVIVRAHIDCEISQEEYERQRDTLAHTTDHPSLLSNFMDNHWQRKPLLPDKIQLTILD